LTAGNGYTGGGRKGLENNQMKIHGTMVKAALAAVLLTVGCGSDDSGGSSGSKGGTGGLAGENGVPSAGEAGSNEGENGGTNDSSAGAAGSDDGPGASGASSGSGGATAGSGGATAGSGGATAGSGGQAQLGFVSQPAGIELELDSASAAGFTLTSSRLTQEASSSLFYAEWYAELHNGTSKTQCLIQISGDFQTATGASIIKFDTFATGAAYKLSDSKLSSPCMAPGESVPVWSNDLPDGALALASIQKVVVYVEPLTVPDAVVHPSTPTLGAVAQTYSSSFEAWALSGSATATADIYNASLTFWGKSGNFYVDNTKVFHLENLLKGQAWPFSTTVGLETVTLNAVVSQFSFINGLESAAAKFGQAEKTPALVARLNEAGNRSDRAFDRRSRFRMGGSGQ
jgi:hypothetical protein